MLTNERADGSMKIPAPGQPVVYGDLLGQYPAMPLIDIASLGGTPKDVWLTFWSGAPRLTFSREWVS